MKISKINIARIITLLLTAATLTSCNTSDNTDSTTAAKDAATDAAGSTGEATSERLKPDLSEADFGGAEITIMGRALQDGGFVKYWSEVASEEQNGETMNDAVYKRNAYVEDKYNVRIKRLLVNDEGSLMADLQKLIRSGDSTVDAAIGGIHDNVGLSQGGLLTDLYNVPNLDLTKPWWDQKSVSELSIGGKLYFAVGDITPWANSFTHVVVFNKEMIQNYELESPYELVRRNEWTFDKFYDYCKAVAGDTDGDGVITEFDRHGVMTANDIFTVNVIAGGEHIVKKDKDDLPYFAINNDRALSVIAKVFELMSDNTVSLNVNHYLSKYNDPWFEVLRAQFRNGNGLFYQGGLEQMLIFRDLDTPIGILPVPKFDSAQEEYYHTMVFYWASSLNIPITNSDPDRLNMTGHIIEALAAESMYTVRPAYYDQTLTLKAMRDEESMEMLDIILASRSYDLGYFYGWGGITGIFGDMISSGTMDFSSRYEKKEASAIKQMQVTVDKFLSLD
ncbi:hypothetical protein FACS1894219_07060 [Clostridia bacterium]|nr:hypothetical protein FACS1894219_07060 [Clostridia bacterium]